MNQKVICWYSNHLDGTRQGSPAGEVGGERRAEALTEESPESLPGVVRGEFSQHIRERYNGPRCEEREEREREDSVSSWMTQIGSSLIHLVYVL